MRVTKSQIVHGITDYIQSDILPKMGNGRALQILVSVGANTIAANHKIVDAIFEHPVVRAVLEDDGTGTYEIDGLMAAIGEAIGQYGSLPIHIPAIPLISPDAITLKLSAEDVDAMHTRIDGAV